MNELVRTALRSTTSTRQRVAAALGYDWRVPDDLLIGAVQAAITDVSPAELDAVRRAGPRTLNQMIELALLYAARKPRGAGSSKPPATGGSKPAPAPAPHTRSTKPKTLLSASEYDRLLALRAKRAGKPAPPPGASGGLDVTAVCTAAELAEIRGGR